jgi:hypothetical protein
MPTVALVFTSWLLHSSNCCLALLSHSKHERHFFCLDCFTTTLTTAPCSSYLALLTDWQTNMLYNVGILRAIDLSIAEQPDNLPSLFSFVLYPIPYLIYFFRTIYISIFFSLPFFLSYFLSVCALVSFPSFISSLFLSFFSCFLLWLCCFPFCSLLFHFCGSPFL